jgi:long-chain acyl-CoA synthetase
VPEGLTWIDSFPEWQKEAMNISQPMFYTSGTTGMPKGVKRKPVAPEIAAKAIKRTGIAFGLSGLPVKSIMTGPLYHSAPNAYGMKVIRDGGLLVLQPRFDAEDLLSIIQHYHITHLHMVPTMFVRMLKLESKIKSSYDLSSLEHIAHGAAPCPADVKKSMIEWLGKVIHEYYAMTETGIIAICDSQQWLDHKGSVGIAVEGIEIKIVDKQGNTCESNEAGEICVSSATTPYVSYHHDDKKTEKMRYGNFVATGDVGYLDADNFLFIRDRITDMVISGGVNIYPAEIEKSLVNMPEVRDCAVFGCPDPDFGERLVAIVEASKALTS